MRALLAAVVAGTLLANSACYRYRPVVTPPAPGAQVRVVFRAPLEVTTLPLEPDTTRRTYGGVFEASGRIDAATTDTIALLLGELRTSAGSLPGLAGRVALLPTAQVAHVEERRFAAGRTLLAGAVAATAALTVYIVLLIATIVKAA